MNNPIRDSDNNSNEHEHEHILNKVFDCVEKNETFAVTISTYAYCKSLLKMKEPDCYDHINLFSKLGIDIISSSSTIKTDSDLFKKIADIFVQDKLDRISNKNNYLTNDEQYVSRLSSHIEGYFLETWNLDPDSAANLTLHLLGYIFMKASNESRGLFLQIINTISKIRDAKLEDFYDMKEWIDEKRINILLEDER